MTEAKEAELKVQSKTNKAEQAEEERKAALTDFESAKIKAVFADELKKIADEKLTLAI